MTDTERMDWLCDMDKVYWLTLQTEPYQKVIFDSCFVTNLRKTIDAMILIEKEKQ